MIAYPQFMGRHGPPPSENPQRRNKESQPHEVHANPDDFELPELPGSYRLVVEQIEGHGHHKTVNEVTIDMPFGDYATETWERVWSSPLARQFRPEMLAALHRWIIYVDRFHQLGHHQVHKEILALEKEFALTWLAQKRERLLFFSRTPKEQADAEEAATKKPAGSARDRSHLRAVETA